MPLNKETEANSLIASYKSWTPISFPTTINLAQIALPDQIVILIDNVINSVGIDLVA